MSISALVAAAKAARRASVYPTRDIEIVLTEIGLVVRGRTAVDGRQFSYSQELNWHEFDGRPELLSNSVNLVAYKLRRAEDGNENG